MFVFFKKERKIHITLLKSQEITNRTRVKCVISEWGQPNHFELEM